MPNCMLGHIYYHSSQDVELKMILNIVKEVLGKQFWNFHNIPVVSFTHLKSICVRRDKQIF